MRKVFDPHRSRSPPTASFDSPLALRYERSGRLHGGFSATKAPRAAAHSKRCFW